MYGVRIIHAHPAQHGDNAVESSANSNMSIGIILRYVENIHRTTRERGQREFEGLHRDRQR